MAPSDYKVIIGILFLKATDKIGYMIGQLHSGCKGKSDALDAEISAILQKKEAEKISDA